MSVPVCSGATLKCPFGSKESKLECSTKKLIISGKAAAVITDSVPGVNIKPFGECKCPVNPAVAAVLATGTGSSAPCTPVTPPPWLGGSPKLTDSQIPVLTDQSKLLCALSGGAGIITITDPSQTRVELK